MPQKTMTMKKHVLILALLYILLPADASGQKQILIPGYDDLFPKEDTLYFPPVEAIHVGKEHPRTHMISYDSEEAALERGYGESSYFQPLTSKLKQENGNGWTMFTGSFKIPFSWAERLPILHIESASSSYEVYVNGEKAGYNQSGRTPADFDIRDYVQEGMNELGIKVFENPVSSVLSADNKKPALNGETYILSQPKVRIRDYVSVVNFEGNDATVQLGVILQTHLLNPRSVRMYYKLLDPAGDEISTGHRDATMEWKEADTVRFFFAINNARPWTHETPDLYTLLVTTQYEGRYTEYVSYKLGLRNITMDGNKLLINGYETPFSIYEYGERLDRTSTAQRLKALKAEGYNMIKLKDYPQLPYFYELCDETGLYVCDQADINTSASGDSRKTGGNPSNDPVWEESFKDRVMSMYYNSRNHPSVIMFSMARNSSNGHNLYKSYEALKKAEHDRPVIYMDGGAEWNTDILSRKAASENKDAIAGRQVLDIRKSGTAPKNITPEVNTDGKGRYNIRNNASISPLRGHLVYTVKQGSKKVSEGALPVSVEPGKTEAYEIPTGMAKPNKKCKYDVKLVSNMN